MLKAMLALAALLPTTIMGFTTTLRTTTTTRTLHPEAVATAALSYRRVQLAPSSSSTSSSSSSYTAPTSLRVSSVGDASVDASSSSSPSEDNTGNNSTSSSTTTTTIGTSATTTTTSTSSTTPSTANSQPSFPMILWKFTRPHTIIGSALAIPALHLLAAPTWTAALAPRTMAACVYAMIPALFMNLYITGLNQITDVEIDKINKPELPMAAGYLSKSTATVIVLLSLLVSLSMGTNWMASRLMTMASTTAAGSLSFATQGLNVALWGSAILGTIYSLEPFRLKRFPVLAAFCIVAVRGAIINAGFFAHAQAAAFGQTTGTTVWQCLTQHPACLWSSVFFAVFGIVIALMKDVPDVVGDKQSNIRTFSVRIGQKTVFHAMRRLLSGTFVAVGAAFLARAALLFSDSTGIGAAVARVITGVASICFGWSVKKEAVGVDPTDSKQVYNFYMHLWKLFYASYLVLPFAM